MIRKIKVMDYPRLIEIWESAVLSTHDFLKPQIRNYAPNMIQKRK